MSPCITDFLMNQRFAAVLDGFWSTAERTGTGTGRNGSGTGNISDRKAHNGYRSITVFPVKFQTVKVNKI